MIRKLSGILAVVMMLGSGIAAAQPDGSSETGGDPAHEAIAQTIADMQSGMRAGDIEMTLGAYHDDYTDDAGNGLEARRTYFVTLFNLGIFDAATFDNDNMEIVVDGETATAGPVTYVTAAGTASWVYTLAPGEDGAWLITAAVPFVPQETLDRLEDLAPDLPLGVSQTLEMNATRGLLADAGILVDRHAMVWVRRLDAPIEEVWETVSTLEGLQQWFLGPVRNFELEEGGAFDHYWSNTVADFNEHEFIDFVQNEGGYAGTGGMRFELARIDDDTTMFMFLDTWDPDVGNSMDATAEQAGGLGTPWPGVAAGWHAMVDNLERAVDGTEPAYDYDELTRFYFGYLRDYFRWNAMVRREPAS